MPLTFEVADFGAFLATRDKGAKLRDELEAKVNKMADWDTLEISFSDVEAATISFTDEFIGKFISRRAQKETPEIAIRLSRLNADLREAVAICLARRELMVVARRGKQLELLGADDLMEATFREARRMRKFRAIDLANALRITPQNANNRLRRLADVGAVARARSAPEGGGKEFLYEAAA